jgi:hypothetical protein
MKTIAFWDVAPCSLEQIDIRFRGAYCLHHQGALTTNNTIIRSLMMEAIRTSETSVNFCETTRRNIPEDSHIQTLRGWDILHWHTFIPSFVNIGQLVLQLKWRDKHSTVI